MTDKNKLLNKIADSTASAFIDEQFGGLDTSGLPLGSSLENLDKQQEASFHDSRFSQPDMSFTDAGSNVLKQFLDAPDVDSMRQSGDPVLVEKGWELYAEQVGREFRAQHPEYYGDSDGDNASLIIETIARKNNLPATTDVIELAKQGLWTADAIAKTYRDLKVKGVIEQAPGEIKALSPQDEHLLKMLLTENPPRIVDAAEAYFKGRCSDHDTFMQINNDPFCAEHQRLTKEGSWWIFEHLPPQFYASGNVPVWVRTPERVRAMKEIIGDRLISFPVLLAAWREVSANEKDQPYRSSTTLRDEIAQQSEPMNLEELNDDELQSTYQKTMQKLSRMSDTEFSQSLKRNR